MNNTTANTAADTDTRGVYIRDPQLRRAYALAHAHWHQWALDVWEHVQGGGAAPQTWAEARRIEAAAGHDPSGIAWISVPEPEPDGAVSHVTGSGRLRWTVGPDGRGDLRVYRPDPSRPDSAGRMVAMAIVRPDGRIAIKGEDFYERHFDVLHCAVCAVLGADRGVPAED